MRILGLDIGDRTIGVAVSDEFCWTAQGLTTISRENIDRDMDILKGIIEEYKIEKIVAGLPKNMNGSIGVQGEKARDFSAILQDRFGLEVILWDERLSTAASEKHLIAANVSRKRRKKVIDKMAAAYILQGYLDSL